MALDIYSGLSGAQCTLIQWVGMKYLERANTVNQTTQDKGGGLEDPKFTVVEPEILL